MSTYVASVVVPAHDEEAVIGRCLEALREGVGEGELEVVVVCNGCTDRTAAIAREAGVAVVETSAPGKPRALDLGDGSVTAFPRFYVDADVVVPGSALLAVAQVLGFGEVEAAAPKVEVDLAEASWAVRCYYQIWTKLPYVSAGHVGSGVVGLSEQGRSRFETFPSAIADDYFLHSLYRPGRRQTVDSVAFTVFPARTARALVRRKTRVFAGNVQLRRLGHGGGPAGGDRGGNALDVVRAEPKLAVALPAFVAISLAAKVLARRKVRRADLGSWERDETSRAGTVVVDPTRGPRG